jgi:hypothetical protein
MEPLQVGTLVHVRATEIERDMKHVLGPWTAKGIVHGVAAANDMYYTIRWLTQGVGSKSSGKPNHLSRFIHRLAIRPLMEENVCQLATVFNDDVNGALTVAYDWPSSGDSTYMMLTGPDAGESYTATTVNLLKLPSAPYAKWAQDEKDRAQRNAAEKAEKEQKKSKPCSGGSRSARKRKARKAYVNPQHGPEAGEHYDPAGRAVFEGSDDPPGTWTQGYNVWEFALVSPKNTYFEVL